jgi:hypothetical protein
VLLTISDTVEGNKWNLPDEHTMENKDPSSRVNFFIEHHSRLMFPPVDSSNGKRPDLNESTVSSPIFNLVKVNIPPLIFIASY